MDQAQSWQVSKKKLSWNLIEVKFSVHRLCLSLPLFFLQMCMLYEGGILEILGNILRHVIESEQEWPSSSDCKMASVLHWMGMGFG